MYKMNKKLKNELNLIIDNVCNECNISQLYKNVDNLKKTLINNFDELIRYKFNIDEIQKIKINDFYLYNYNDNVCYCESNDYYYDYNALIRINFTIKFLNDDDIIINKFNAYFFVDNCNVVDFTTTMFELMQNEIFC